MMKKITLATLVLALLAVSGCSDDKESKSVCNVKSFNLQCEDQEIQACRALEEKDRGYIVTNETYEVNGVVYACDADDNVIIKNECSGNSILNSDGQAVESLQGYYSTVKCEEGVVVDDIPDVIDPSGGEIDPGDNDSDVVPSKDNTKCVDGSLFIGSGDDYTAASSQYFCDQEEGFIYGCDGDKRVLRAQYCNGDTVVSCVKNESTGVYEVSSSACASNETCVEYDKADQREAACFDQSDVSDECGDIKVYGKCDANGSSLYMCSNDKGDGTGKLLHITCSGQKSCVLVEESSYGYDCAITCENDGETYNDFGTCVDNKLYYCNQSGEYAEPVVCEASQSCGWDSTNIYYNCL